MQLVEQGKLDLDADVNKYLDFEIPARDGQPITLRNIMTHTPGFEEQVKGLMGVEGQAMRRWASISKTGCRRAFSRRARRRRIRTMRLRSPATLSSACPGMSFDDYIDQHIFAPLGMKHSTFRQPLPEQLKPDMSKGYRGASQPTSRSRSSAPRRPAACPRRARTWRAS